MDFDIRKSYRALCARLRSAWVACWLPYYLKHLQSINVVGPSRTRQFFTRNITERQVLEALTAIMGKPNETFLDITAFKLIQNNIGKREVSIFMQVVADSDTAVFGEMAVEQARLLVDEHTMIYARDEVGRLIEQYARARTPASEDLSNTPVWSPSKEK